MQNPLSGLQMTNLTQVRLGNLKLLGKQTDFCVFISQENQEEYYKITDIETLLKIADLKSTLSEDELISFDDNYLVRRKVLIELTASMELKAKDILKYSLEEFNNGAARPFLCSLNYFSPVDPVIVKTFAIGSKRSSPTEETRKRPKYNEDLTIDVNKANGHTGQSTKSTIENNLPSLTNMLDADMRRKSVTVDDQRKMMMQNDMQQISNLKQQIYKKRAMPPFGLNTTLKPDLLTPSKSSPGHSSNGLSSSGHSMNMNNMNNMNMNSGMSSNGTPITPKPTVKQMFLPMFDKLCEYMDAQTARIDVSLNVARNTEKGLHDIRKQFKEFADNMNNNFLVELKKILVSVDSRLRKLERASLMQTPSSDDMKFFATRKSSLRE